MNVSTKYLSARVIVLLGLMHVLMTTHAKTIGGRIGYGLSRATVVQKTWGAEPSKRYLLQLGTSVKRYCICK